MTDTEKPHISKMGNILYGITNGRWGTRKPIIVIGFAFMIVFVIILIALFITFMVGGLKEKVWFGAALGIFITSLVLFVSFMVGKKLITGKDEDNDEYSGGQDDIIDCLTCGGHEDELEKVINELVKDLNYDVSSTLGAVHDSVNAKIKAVNELLEQKKDELKKQYNNLSENTKKNVMANLNKIKNMSSDVKDESEKTVSLIKDIIG